MGSKMTPPLIHVLAVDDEPEICALTKEFLELAGDLVVDTVTSAVEARKAVSRERYQVIISDYQMPTEDGIQLLKQLRASGNMTPFILFTGRGREEVVIEAIDNGAYAYIQKGGAPDALYTELAHNIRNAVLGRRVELSLLSSADDLQMAASRYEALIAASNTGAWEYHLDSGRLWCSPEYFSMLGRDLREYEGGGPLDLEGAWKALLHPDDREAASRNFEEYLRQPQGIYQQYFRMLHRNGSWIWIWSRGKFLPSTHSADRAVVGSHIDVSERRKAEESLIESENRYRTLVELAPMAVLVNRNERVVLVNQACLQLFGASTANQLLGRSIYELFHPDYHDKVRGRIHELRDLSKAVPGIEEKIIRLDGKVVDVEVSAVPFKDQGVNAIHVVLRDITERKLAEESSKANHLKIAMAMELTGMAQWEMDMATGMFTFNDQFYALYATTAEREGGNLMRPERYLREFVHPEDVPKVQEVMQTNLTSLHSPHYAEIEHRIIRRDGEVRHFLIRIGSIVEGALYHSMLENDKSSLQYTLDVINTLPGIDEVNMYDSDDDLVYSSIASDTNNNHSNPNCVSCHNNIRSMFPDKGKSYKILDVDSDCKMIRNDNTGR
ncbi:MAG: PAS domain S-box protein, partial [Methanomassiliicoccales archaeon]